MSNTVVRTNVMAINSHRNLGLVGVQQTRASQRLSSGFRINSGADDAAGLAISEGMRAQIRGMNQASRNSQDGISLIQTSEGYMQTITEIAQRMRELSVQASNDTNAVLQREYIAGEMGQLMSEIERIWDTATFNGMNIFNAGGDPVTGLTAASEVLTDAAQDAIDDINVADIRLALEQLQEFVGQDTTNVNLTMTNAFGAGGAFQNLAGATSLAAFNTAMGLGAAGDLAALSSALLAVGSQAMIGTAAHETAVGRASLTGLAVLASGVQADLAGGATVGAAIDRLTTILNNVDIIQSGLNDFLRDNTESLGEDTGLLIGDFFLQVGPNGSPNVAGNALHVSGQYVPGDTNLSEGQLGNAVHDVAAGIQTVRGALDARGQDGRGEFLPTDEMLLVSNTENDGSSHRLFSDFIDTVGNFLDDVATLRSGLGAIQNRLEFTIENLDIASENLSAAESRIRDADMAMEMMRLTQANILQQAATSMLAQANQAPQNVLQLLG